jgi:hypothetical protein
MGENGIIGALAIALKVLCHDGGDGHGDPDEAILVDADPNNVEPGQAAFWSPPRAPLAATALGKPTDGQDPLLDRIHVSEEVLLVMQVGSDVMAQESEEAGDGKGLVAVADDLIVYRMPVEAYLQECAN